MYYYKLRPIKRYLFIFANFTPIHSYIRLVHFYIDQFDMVIHTCITISTPTDVPSYRPDACALVLTYEFHARAVELTVHAEEPYRTATLVPQ